MAPPAKTPSILADLRAFALNIAPTTPYGDLAGLLREAGFDADLVAAALTQSRLRARAVDKFGPFAAGLLLTADGLEQATRLTVAAAHAHRYRAAIKRMIDLGMLKISTDSALHLVRREKQPNGTHEVKRWPIIAASLTPSAAEPRLFDVQALKSWYGVAGIDLPFGIDDGAEPTKVADDERTRRITLELELLELDAA